MIFVLLLAPAGADCVPLPRPEPPPITEAAAAVEGGVTITVHALDPDDRPVANVPVTVSSEQRSDAGVQALTDADGTAVLGTSASKVLWVYVNGDATLIEGSQPGQDLVVKRRVPRPPAPPAPGTGDLPRGMLLTYSRGACLGPCPVFDVQLTDTGALTWVGESDVRKDGTHERALTREQLAAVRDELACFTQIPRYDHHGSTDHPWVRLTFRHGGDTYRWAWYTGDDRAPRDALEKAQARLEKALGIKRWF